MNKLCIKNGNKIYYPMTEEGITWSTERKSSPGCLKFKVLYDKDLKIEEGDMVQFYNDETGVFLGFVFKKELSKAGLLSITAYDQLRYFKNKNNYIYNNKSTSELVKMIAKDFLLQTGKLADTSYKMSRIESESTLFDIFNNSNDETLRVMNKMYILYDEFGKLTLKDVEDMRLDLLIYEQTAGDYSLTSSIDDNTYNQIKLTYDNDKTGTREQYIKKDSNTIQKWGVLQYLESIDDPSIAKTKLNALLSYYNVKTKTLKLKDCFGDIRVRAGTQVFVKLNQYDFNYCNYMLVEAATHTFYLNEHKMDLTVRGGEVNSG